MASTSRERSLRNIDPNCTVEEFLESQRDKLVKEMETTTGTLVEELQEACDQAKASLRAEFQSAVSTQYAVTVAVTGGAHVGASFELRVGGEEACYVGRSTGKKFRVNGISLPKDGEVSTTHAKIEVHQGNVVIVDVGSTNGSTLDETDLVEHVAVPVKVGSMLLVGSSLLTFQTIQRV